MISFVIPVYNGERYLRECLDSIVGQSFRDLEVIVVNDGSRDGSQKIIEEYVRRDPRIVSLVQENQGVSAARNLGLSRAQGEYVWFFDCDDVLLEGAVKAMYDAVSGAQADLAVGNYQLYQSSSGKVSPSQRWLHDHAYCGDRKLFCTHLSAFPMNKLWRRSVIEAHGLRFGRLCVGEDVDFYLRFLAVSGKVVTLESCTCSYRLHDGSSSHTWSEKTGDVIDAFEGVETFYRARGGMERFIRELNHDKLFCYSSWVKDLPRCRDSRLRRKLLDAFLKAEERTGDSGIDGEAGVRLRKWFARIRRCQRFYGSSFYSTLYCLLRQGKHGMEWMLGLLRPDAGSARSLDGAGGETQTVVQRKDGPLVSVVIPVYNVESYLNRCLESVTRQSYPRLQIILVDDGSTDQSGALCEQWAAADSRIQVVHKVNAGLGMARNTGLEYVQGAYVTFVDSDDYIEPKLVELLLETIEAGKGRVCFGGCIDVMGDGTRRYGNPPRKLVYEGPDEIMAFMANALGVPPQVSENCFAGISAWGNLYASSLFADGKCRFFREQDVLSEDVFFNLDVCRSVDRVLVAPWCLYNYCENQNSLTTKYRESRFEAYKTMKRLLEKKLEKELAKNPSLGRHIDRGYMDGLIVCIRQELRFRKQFGKKLCMERIGKMAEDPMTRQVLSHYPIAHMQWKQRVLFSLIRRGRLRAVCWLFLLRYGE